MSKVEELKDLNQNLAYENKKMGDFLESLGLTIDEITDIVINGEQLNLDIIKKIRNKTNVLERKFVKDEIRKLSKRIPKWQTQTIKIQNLKEQKNWMR